MSGEPASSVTTLAVSAIDCQFAATALAIVATAGFVASLGLSSSIVYGSFAPGGRHLPPVFFQPAFVSAVAAALALWATVGLAAGSKAHDVGGIGLSAATAKTANAAGVKGRRSVAPRE